jgi:hypothetical protein
MSFFGFDSTLPRDRGHESRAPGFGAPQDAFGAPPSRDTGDDDVYVVLKLWAFELAWTNVPKD